MRLTTLVDFPVDVTLATLVDMSNGVFHPGCADTNGDSSASQLRHMEELGMRPKKRCGGSALTAYADTHKRRSENFSEWLWEATAGVVQHALDGVQLKAVQDELHASRGCCGSGPCMMSGHRNKRDRE